MRQSAANLLMCCLLAAAAGTAMGVERFPQPEFDSAYVQPQTAVPSGRAAVFEYVDVAVLVAALAAAAYLALRVRSRRGLLLLTVFSVLYFGFWKKGCVCAVGAIQNVALQFADPGFAVPLSVVLFFLLPLVFALFFGRAFCAAVCPLGAIQDVVVLRPLSVPAWLAKPLRLLPYVYLGAVVLLTVTGAGFYICRFDPFVSFFRLGGSPLMLAVGAAVIVIGVFIARPYCRFLCPYGVLLNWASRLSKWHLSITPDECVRCRLCEDACPFGAIRKPTPATFAEPRRIGVRRLAALLVVLPALVVTGVVVGGRLELPLARLHRDVSLAERVLSEKADPDLERSLEGDAFRADGEPVDRMLERAVEVRRQFRNGGRVFGAYVGLVLGGGLLSLSVRRRREDYEADRGECLGCGRCFRYCPREHLRRRGGAPAVNATTGTGGAPEKG